MSTLTLDAFSRRSNVLARRGMVATSQPLAAMAGLRMLLEGGNAADAAVATAAALAVVEPMSTGIGGDAFALFYDAAAAPQQRISALTGRGRAPAGLHLEDLRRAGLAEIGLESPHSVTVPGTVAAWADLLARHGTMPLSVVLQPAIEYARDGFPVSELIAASWQRGEARLGFTAHSSPFRTLDRCGPGLYPRQVGYASSLIAAAAGYDDYDVVWQSRSGPPQVPWLEPDVGDHLSALAEAGTKSVIVCPVGFVADHIEVVWDLDNELAEQAAELGVALARATTPNAQPRFARLALDLLDEVREGRPASRVVGPEPASAPPGYGAGVNGQFCTAECVASAERAAAASAARPTPESR